MAQNKHEIQALLAGAGARPLHRFGQNFMIDQNLVRLIAEAGSIENGDLVLEVGPGTGTLTEELLSRTGRVVGVEIDRGLSNLLRERYRDRPFELIEGDALAGKHALSPALQAVIAEAKGRGQKIRLVSNLPYNIASPLIIELLIAGVDLLACTIQKEVADRLRAAAGTEDYGPLSIMAQLLADVEFLRTIPPQAFWPTPKIESGLARLTRNDRLGESAGAFSIFVHQVFSARRKMLRKALERTGVDVEGILERTKIPGDVRPEGVSPGEFLQIFMAK